MDDNLSFDCERTSFKALIFAQVRNLTSYPVPALYCLSKVQYSSVSLISCMSSKPAGVVNEATPRADSFSFEG